MIKTARCIYNIRMNDEKILQIIADCKLPAYRAQQLRDGFFQQHRDGAAELTVLPRALREQIAAAYAVFTVTQRQIKVSSDGRAHKAIVALADGKLIETVLLNPKPGLWSCCISSQVGCALRCSFCATGAMGFIRNLSAEEITDQVLFWRRYIRREEIPAALHNVVYMGMGEPFHNRKAVFASLEELCNPHTFNMGARRLSVSTAGLAPGIVEFGERFPQVNLAVSLHAANDELRQRLMPVNKAFPLAELLAALRTYLERTNRKVFIEYILLDRENDSEEHARELARLLKTLNAPARLHVNLIVYNKTRSDHQESSRLKATAFKHVLQQYGLHATIRKNLGRDIDGACGQLITTEMAGGRHAVAAVQVLERNRNL